MGNVTPQHVGRLRRVFERFAESRDDYADCFGAIFRQPSTGDDAEMWLEGAVQNDWSISQMRSQRAETLGQVAEETAPVERNRRGPPLGMKTPSRLRPNRRVTATVDDVHDPESGSERDEAGDNDESPYDDGTEADAGPETYNSNSYDSAPRRGTGASVCQLAAVAAGRERRLRGVQAEHSAAQAVRLERDFAGRPAGEPGVAQATGTGSDGVVALQAVLGWGPRPGKSRFKSLATARAPGCWPSTRALAPAPGWLGRVLRANRAEMATKSASAWAEGLDHPRDRSGCLTPKG